MEKNFVDNTKEELIFNLFKKGNKYKKNKNKLITAFKKINKIINKYSFVSPIKKILNKKRSKKFIIINNKKHNNKIDNFEITISNFVNYINNFKPLYNENINRLKYYHYTLSKTIYYKIDNINNISINKTYIDLSSKLFTTKIDEKMSISSFIALIIVFYSYKEVINFIPKKNIFCKKIERKIDNLASFFVKNINFNNYFYLEDVIEEVKKVTKLDYFKILSLRQKYRNNYNNTFNNLYFNDSINI